MAAVARGLRKWGTVFSVYMQDNLTYRAQSIIWMLTDAVPAVLMPLVWLASYQGRLSIGGFTPNGMVAYYVITLVLTNFMISHIMWDMATEIREGRFNVYLTRPFSYLAFQYAGNLSWRAMRLAMFLPIGLGVGFIFRGYLRWEGYDVGGSFWAAVLLGHLLSFFIGYAMGLLALVMTETRSVFMAYYLPMSFLSGEMVPLNLLPHWATRLGAWLPFRYTLAFPAEIFLRKASPEQVWFGFAVLGGWLVVAWAAGQLMWRFGLRRYTGVGM